jgi:glycosyltransferase involved in cell wall biosynthesis
VVSSVPNACDYVRDLGAERVVYYCVDDFTQWPGFEHGLVRDMESRLINASDVLLATSRKLQSTLGVHGKPVHLFTHGVDLDLFASEAATLHPALATVAAPRVGYFGLIDERSDQKLLGDVIRKMPDVSFVFTGPIATPVESLARYPNAHFTGPLPYGELPALVRGLSALMLPYLVNDFTASISPLKLKEYLATGRPVIATPMPEAILQAPHVTIADGADAWVSAIRASLGVDINSRRILMQQVLAGESWRDKADAFMKISTSEPSSVTAPASSAAAARPGVME